VTSDYEKFQRLLTSLERLKTYMPFAQLKNFPAYQNILVMGDAARPFIIDLLRDGDHWPGWITLLRELTPTMDPVTIHERGNIAEEAKAWCRLADVKGW